MMHRDMFMIIDDNVKYLSSDIMDHRDWYRSLGLNESAFDDVVRGYLLDGKLIFFKGSNFNYDGNVIDAARKYGITMKNDYNNQDLKICCGITINPNDGKYEPIMYISDDELIREEVNLDNVENSDNSSNENNQYISRNYYGHVENAPILELKNDYDSDEYIKWAVYVTLAVIILNVIIKIVLFIQNDTLHFSSFGDVLFVLIQFGLLIFTLLRYLKKDSIARYLALASCFFLIITFDIFDIIIGILYFVFTIDLSYFTKGYGFIKKLINRKKER